MHSTETTLPLCGDVCGDRLRPIILFTAGASLLGLVELGVSIQDLSELTPETAGALATSLTENGSTGALTAFSTRPRVFDPGYPGLLQITPADFTPTRISSPL